MMSTYRWATTSPARSTQPPWLQPSHCLPPLIQVARIVDMTKYCCALTSTGLSLGKLNTLNFAAKPLKLHTHGFMDTTAGEGTLSKHTYFVNGESWFLCCCCYSAAVGVAGIAQRFLVCNRKS